MQRNLPEHRRNLVTMNQLNQAKARDDAAKKQSFLLPSSFWLWIAGLEILFGE